MVKREAWERMDLAPYVGEWIVFEGNRMLGHDRDLRNLKSVLDACKGIPSVFKVPKHDILLF